MSLKETVDLMIEHEEDLTRNNLKSHVTEVAEED
jgi:hypothetical protein